MIEETWATPDGEVLFTDPAQVSRALAQLACGFWYRWAWEKVRKGGPDEEWMTARAWWASEVRKFLSGYDLPPLGLDSDKLLFDAAMKKNEQLPASLIEAGLNWAPIKDRWRVDYGGRRDARTIPVQAVWVSEFLIDDALAWAEAQGEPVLLWYSHRALEQAFKRRQGLTVYDPRNSPPQERKARVPRIAAASITAHGTGRNLQHGWGNQLVTSAFSSHGKWEQLLGRTHRTGQRRGEVKCSINVHTPKLMASWDKAVARSARSESLGGGDRKLLLATILEE